MNRLLNLFGRSKPIPLHDLTDARLIVRALANNDSHALADASFQCTVEHVTTATERTATAERLRTRRAWIGAAA